jgi:hypothetical protein
VQESRERLERLRALLALDDEARSARGREGAAQTGVHEAELAERRAFETEEAAAGELRQAEERAQQALAALEAARQELEQAQLGEERRRLVAELERLRGIEAQLVRLRAARAELRPASADELARLAAIEKDELGSRAVVQAERLVLELHAESRLEPVVSIDGTVVKEELAARATARHEGVQIRLVLPGIATVLVGRPGAGEQASRRLEELGRQKAELLGRYAAPDAEALRATSGRAAELEREIELRLESLGAEHGPARLEERIARLPAEGQDPQIAAERREAAQQQHAALNKAVAAARRKLEKLRQAAGRAREEAQKRRDARSELLGRAAALEDRRKAETAAAGLAEAGRPELESAAAASAEALAVAERGAAEGEAQRERQRTALVAARKTLAAVSAELSGAESDLRNAQLALQQAQTARLRSLDGRAEDELRREADELGVRADEAHTALARLPGLPPHDPRGELETIEKSLAQLRKDWNERHLRQVRLEQELEQLGSLGLYEKLAETRERLEVCRRELASERLKASATRHLRDLLREAQEEARRKLGGPIRDWMALRAREVLGEQYDDVVFSGELLLEQVSRRGMGGTAPVAELSRGTRDLLGLLVRLAIAELLSKKERQLVVLDDVLVHADASRRRRVLQILRESAEHVQILVCTCHPDQYVGLGDEARRFELEQLKSGP